MMLMLVMLRVDALKNCLPISDAVMISFYAYCAEEEGVYNLDNV